MEHASLDHSGRKTFGSKETSEKVALFFRTEWSKRKFVFHFFKVVDTSYAVSWPLFGKWN